MLDTDTILGTFIKIAQSELAGLISESGPSGGPNTPNVIKARQEGVRPEFPFVQLDILAITDTNGYLTNTMVDPDNSSNNVYDTHTKLKLQYVVYGGNASVIANKLKHSFRRDIIYNQISTETFGELEQVFPVMVIPSNLSSVKYDVASFDLTFNINDRFIDTEIGTFDTIMLTGELKLDKDDPESLTLDITVPVP